jgi:di/tricarboxylate transporter
MFEPIYTGTLLILMLILVARDTFRPSILAFGMLVLLVLGGVITTDEAFNGFSNHGMLTVGLLFVVSAALQVSGVFEAFIAWILGDNNTGNTVRYFRLLFPVAGLSAFLNNTPIVASMLPIIKAWAKKHNLAASKYLIPLSYAAILGGMCTLIGTSTNLIVHGQLLENGLEGFSFFEISKIGLPVTLLTLIFLVFIGPRLLPDRKEPIAQLGESTREFVVECKIGNEYPHIGKTVQDANLRHLHGLYLFQITRRDKVIAPVSHNTRLEYDDRLFFTGLPETIMDLQRTPGLHSIKDPEFDLKNFDSDKLQTFEAVVSNNSPLIGQTVRDSQFRQRYGGVILAIHRSGSRVNKKVGSIVFEPSDTLFILARKGFAKKYYHASDFSLVSSSVDVVSKPKWKGNLALFILVMMILAAALKLLPIVTAAALAAGLLVIMGIIEDNNAFKAVDWHVLLYIASSFGIAKGMANSGLADLVAKTIVNLLDFWGPIGIMGGLFIVTSSFTWLITNNAVAAIMFPVTISIAKTVQMDIKPFMLVLAVAASTCFATPIGYQTNLMVYSAGGYKFRDFLKIGIPTTLFVGILSMIVIYLLYFR